MTTPPLDMDSLLISGHVLQVFGRIHRLAYAFIDRDLRILHASGNFASTLSEPGGDFQDQLLPDVIWEFAGTEDNLRAILEGRLPYLAFERVNRRWPNGRLLYLDFNVTGVSDIALGRGLLLIVEDVTYAAETEQRLTQNRNELALIEQQLARSNQKLEHLDRMKSLFLSMAAHDLRGPLTVIHMYSELASSLLKMNAADKVEEILQQIGLQTNSLEWLINDLLDLDQIERGTLKINPARHDLNEVVNKVATPFVRLAQQKKITIHLNLSPEPIWLSVDGARMEQVISNLLNNAIKYTLTGGQVALETALMEKTAVIRVTDNGIGMTADVKERAFRLYYRAPANVENPIAEAERTHSKGLGLFIVKTLVEAHGGNVTVESEPNRGTAITVQLPAEVSEA